MAEKVKFIVVCQIFIIQLGIVKLNHCLLYKRIKTVREKAKLN